ncbi:MAG: glycyl-radical enzyme activating protein [Treponema sp.]|jgi:pyruvate formate lyase activating enzyme|nr:glycyl-radical enzyme activating protein [Treponema sp.]
MAERDTTGAIFDIRRFSIHDGQGIRTTVFLKGCPLRCRWCQNPEGLDFEARPVWFERQCIHCRACTEKAAHISAAPMLAWEGEKLRIEDSGHTAWDTVINACPTRSLVWDSRTISVPVLLAELEKDRMFFNHGGGVTLSGGEPLAQGEFAIAILSACRRAGFHTAVETSLFTPPEIVDTAAALCDTIIADCKIFDEQRHLEATDQSNAIILENIRCLLSGPHAQKVLIRTPLIPGFTAVRENIAAISAFISGIYKDVAYELLNYNPLAAGKYPLTGRAYCFTENPKPYKVKEMQRFKDIARINGITNLKETS